MAGQERIDAGATEGSNDTPPRRHSDRRSHHRVIHGSARMPDVGPGMERSQRPPESSHVQACWCRLWVSPPPAEVHVQRAAVTTHLQLLTARVHQGEPPLQVPAAKSPIAALGSGRIPARNWDQLLGVQQVANKPVAAAGSDLDREVPQRHDARRGEAARRDGWASDKALLNDLPSEWQVAKTGV